MGTTVFSFALKWIEINKSDMSHPNFERLQLRAEVD